MSGYPWSKNWLVFHIDDLAFIVVFSLLAFIVVFSVIGGGSTEKLDRGVGGECAHVLYVVLLERLFTDCY